MWKMFESDFLGECGDDACDGPGPPPKFHLPPPPRPPFLQDLNAVLGTNIECSDDPTYDIDVCAAIPSFDANFRSSSTLQTSAIITVCSIFLLLVILFSSLFLWKHKRKMQNFWPCKSLPKRNGHLDTSAVSSGAHSVAYEDPDAHLHHHPLVLRHHNMEMLHPKSIHFPSGYPISRSPPVFVCASPGPDPYRSLDNVYEELGPRDSDIESEPRVQSDDDFAEDELSLNGGAVQPYHTQDIALATPQTTIPMATSTSTCAAISQISSIYNECINSNGINLNATTNGDNNNGESSQINGNANEIERIDRGSLLSSSSSSTSTAPVNDCAIGRNSNSSSSSGPTRVVTPDSGLAVRNRCKRLRNAKANGNDLPASSRLNENGSIDDTSSESNHLMNQQHYLNQHHHHNQYRTNNNHAELSHSNSNTSSLSVHLNNVNNNVNRSGNAAPMANGSQCNDVERHNQINKQLSSTEHPLIPKFGLNRLPSASNTYQNQMSHGEQMVSTIFPGRLMNASANGNSYNRHQMHNQYYAPCDNARNGNASNRSRTNPRSSRHRNIANAIPYSYQNENAYSYAEPIFREDLVESCAPPLLGGYRTISTSNRHPYDGEHATPYVVSAYQDYNDRFAGSRARPVPSTSAALNDMSRIQPIYSHDSSFGSDSGYSQYTHNSRSKSEGSNSAHSGSSNGNGTFSNMFSWGRRKNQQQAQQPTHRNKMNTSVRNS